MNGICICYIALWSTFAGMLIRYYSLCRYDSVRE